MNHVAINLLVVSRLRWCARWAGDIVIVIGILVLLGWTLHIDLLKHVVEGLVPMNPMSAVCFILSGLGLRLMWQAASIPQRRVAEICSWLVLLIALVRLVDYLVPQSLGVDLLLFRQQMEFGPEPSRMAPNSAINFIVASLALLLIATDFEFVWPFAQYLGLLLAGSVVFALMGYLYGVEAFYRVVNFDPMSLHSSFAFLVLACGILCVRPAAGPMSTITASGVGGLIARRLIPACILIPAILGKLTLLGEEQGLYGTPMATAMFVITVMLAFLILVWWHGNILNRVDTERRRAAHIAAGQNRKLEQTIQQLKQAQSHLVQTEKLTALGQMVAGIAHEINNPLSFVSNNLTILERDLASIFDLLKMYQSQDPLIQQHNPELLGQIRELIERIDLNYTIENAPDVFARSQDGIHRIARIVRDLRDFARLDTTDLQEVDVNSGIESAVNLARGWARKKQVQIVTDLHPVPPVQAFGAKINEVVMNLLTNAVEASPPNQTVTIHTEPEHQGIRIDIIDKGRGIEPNLREKIFDPFFTTKEPGRGTGLGLSVTYGIVREHGGHIDVDSQPGQGATFTVHLPQRLHPDHPLV